MARYNVIDRRDNEVLGYCVTKNAAKNEVRKMNADNAGRYGYRTVEA